MLKTIAIFFAGFIVSAILFGLFFGNKKQSPNAQQDTEIVEEEPLELPTEKCTAEKAKIAKLERQIASMKTTVANLDGSLPTLDRPTFAQIRNPNKQLLEHMAKTCTLHLILPKFLDEASDDRWITGTTKQEDYSIRKITHQVIRRYDDQMSQLYQQVTNARAPSLLTTGDVLAAADRYADEDTNRPPPGIIKKLAQERAGWQAVRIDSHPWEQALRLAMRVQKDYLQSLTQLLGADRSAKILDSRVIGLQIFRLQNCD